MKHQTRTILSALRNRWSGLSQSARRALWIGGGVIVALIAWWIAAIAFAPAPKKTAPPVTVAKAVRQNIDVREHAVGIVVADATVNVTARVGGEIVAIGFKEGQDVKKGDVLFRLDPRPLQAAAAEAKATLQRDRATLTSDRLDADRYTKLAAQNAASAQTRDQSIAAAKAMAATVAADKAALTTAELNLQYAAIRAPIDGKTGAIAVQIGNMVVANAATALVTIAKDRPAKVSFFLSQDKLAKIQKQMRSGKMTADIAAEGWETHLRVPVDFVGNAVSQTNGTIELRATCANADRALVPGQMVGVDVVLETLRGAVVIPRNAVNPGPDRNYVFVVENGKAKQTPVTVRYETADIAAVSGAVKPGDLVVTDGQLRLTDGKPVKIAGHGAGQNAHSSPGAQ